MKHSITTLAGMCALALGAWSFYVHWVPNQTLYFNFVFAEVPSLGLIFSGCIGIWAADEKR